MERNLGLPAWRVPSLGLPFLEMPTLSGARLRRYAGYLSIGYLVVCGLYIVFSGETALQVAQTQEQLAWIERVKGLAFVVVSSLLLYAIARILAERIIRQERELSDQRIALLESETRAAAGLMAASVAHDIKNVLTLLTLLNFQLYRLDPARDKQVDQGQVVQKMGEAVERLNGLSLRLLALSRNGVSELAMELDLTQIIQEDVEFIRLHETVRSCRLELLNPSSIVMPVRRGLIDQMMLNLILNAAEAVSGAGTIQIQLYRTQDMAVIEVHDIGSGLAETDTAALFHAFTRLNRLVTGWGCIR